MRYFTTSIRYALAGLLVLATSCTSFEDEAVIDPAVVGLQAAVELQRKVVIKTKQDAYREEELLKVKESQLAAAQHGMRADEAVN
jgi:hypothetical protein